jgi:hypothetical protein
MENERFNIMNYKLKNFIPACGGTEEPFKTRTGITVQYLWNPTTKEHAYINCDTDILLTDYEVNLLNK